jgi:hypothetical protein
MALVKQGTFRLVGTVDVGAVIEELASSEPDDILAFCCVVVGQHGCPELAEDIAAALRAMEWIFEELEADPLADNLDNSE